MKVSRFARPAGRVLRTALVALLAPVVVVVSELISWRGRARARSEASAPGTVTESSFGPALVRSVEHVSRAGSPVLKVRLEGPTSTTRMSPEGVEVTDALELVAMLPPDMRLSLLLTALQGAGVPVSGSVRTRSDAHEVLRSVETLEALELRPDGLPGGISFAEGDEDDEH